MSRGRSRSQRSRYLASKSAATFSFSRQRGNPVVASGDLRRRGFRPGMYRIISASPCSAFTSKVVEVLSQEALHQRLEEAVHVEEEARKARSSLPHRERRRCTRTELRETKCRRVRGGEPVKVPPRMIEDRCSQSHSRISSPRRLASLASDRRSAGSAPRVRPAEGPPRQPGSGDDPSNVDDSDT